MWIFHDSPHWAWSRAAIIGTRWGSRPFDPRLHRSLFVFCSPPFFRSHRFFANELLNAKKNSSVRYGNCELFFFSVSLVTCIDNTQHNKHKLFMTTKKTKRQLISCNNGKSRLPEHFRLPLPICVIFCNNLARVLLDSAAEASLIVHCYRQLISLCSCAIFMAQDKDKSSIALPKKASNNQSSLCF